jgi:hypothetical protein
MVTNEQVAQVLEDAARLYKDEEINWCSGGWIDVKEEEWARLGDSIGAAVPLDDALNVFDTEGLQISACAEGALLRASGFSWSDVGRYEVCRDEDDFLDRHGEPADLFRATVKTVEERLNGGVSLPEWNDKIHLRYDTEMRRTRDTVAAKQDVIDLFEATAKDLRNHG